MRTDGFSETGGTAALTVSQESTDATFATLGLRASADFMLGGKNAMARGMLGWRHAFGDDTPVFTHAFAGGDSFAISGTPIARDTAVIEAGLDFALSPSATLALAYSGQIGDGVSDHGLNAELAITF